MTPVPQSPYEERVSECVMTSPVNLTSTNLDDMNGDDPKVTAALARINTAFPIGIEEARSLSQVLSRQISKDYDILCGILNSRGELIYNRWLNKKKTIKQRKEILMKAWPKMEVNHRPDLAILWKELRQAQGEEDDFREAFMWPYINLEDLSKGKVLPLFLQARACNPPHAFAELDWSAMRLGLSTPVITPCSVNGYTMLLNEHTGNEYGQIVAEKDEEKGFQLAPGQGLLVLQVQQRTLKFLVKCCAAILHDIPPEKLTNVSSTEPNTMKDNITLQLSQLSRNSELPSLATMTSEAPYRVPRHLDFNALQGLISTKLSEAEDHIWQLREDPGYFAENIKDEIEHDLRQCPDMFGMKHPAVDKPEHWDLMLRLMVSESYQDVELWKLAHRDVQALKALEEKYRDTIVSTCELPDEFESEFCHFATLMDYFCQYFLNRLGGALPASPPLRHLFIQENHGEAATIMHKENYLKNRGSSSYLMWIFHALSEKTLLCKIGLPTALDELQRLLDMDKENHDLITAKVARIISDLAIVEELMRQFEMYQPWFTMVTRRATSTDTYLVAFNKKLQSIRIPFRDNLRNRKIHLEYGDPLDGGFSYPCHKRRTKEITEKLCRAERMLDDFWAKVDTGTGYTDGYIYTQDGRTIQRTPEWSEPEPKQALVAPKTSLIPTELLSQMKLATPDDVKDQAATYSQPKVKVKTRGPQSITAAEISRMEEVVAQKDIQPSYHVKRSVYKVFRTLFFVPSLSEQPGEITWAEFLNAMKETGFAFQKLYGSVWQFTPQNLDVERKINFHEPHPEKKVPFRTCRGG